MRTSQLQSAGPRCCSDRAAGEGDCVFESVPCCPAEAGDYCQPGIGGACKFYVLRELIANHTGQDLPEPPPPPAIHKCV